jgi:hypothetical protein
MDKKKILNSAQTKCWTKILKLLSLVIGEATEPNNAEFIERVSYWISEFSNFGLFNIFKEIMKNGENDKDNKALFFIL